MKRFPTKEAWKNARTDRVGGSEAAALVGLNPWLNNVELWKIKTGRMVPPEVKNSAVAYGTKAEPLIRQFFALDNPQLVVDYVDNNMWINDDYPFAHASLDGWLTDEQGRKGVFESKTGTISSAAQRKKWDHRIPDNYYCQLLWYLGVTEFDFAMLRARLRYSDGMELKCIEKEYFIEASEVRGDIDTIMEAGREFWTMVENDTEPGLVLPPL
jgi:putative phage-type endonuclease